MGQGNTAKPQASGRAAPNTEGVTAPTQKQTKIVSMNLASNMISGEGLELLLDDLIANTSLKHLDLGVLETSMRKNSLGI
jgi:uncharacterized protein YlxW (UPF0749 family)